MGMEHIVMKMEQNMWVIGSWTNSMAKGLKLGEMEPSTKEIM